jgi:hypothetical protein
VTNGSKSIGCRTGRERCNVIIQMEMRRYTVDPWRVQEAFFVYFTRKIIFLR